MIATNHRSEQTREQIRLTNSQNNFTNYYKHLEEFEKFCVKTRDKNDSFYYSFNFRALHSRLFDRAKDGNYSPSIIFIDDFVEYTREMLLLLTSPKANEEAKIDAICEFMSEQASFHGKHQISLPNWNSTRSVYDKVVPGGVDEIFSSLVLLLSEINELARFDTTYKESSEMLRLINLDLSSYYKLSTYDLSKENFDLLFTEVSGIK